MSWSALFTLTNIVALVGWAMIAALPRSKTVYSVVMYACVGLLCLTYAAMFVGLFGGLADPVRVAGAAEPDFADYSIAGLRGLFMSDGSIVLGWTHYLAFDLFIGLWIARDADAKGFSRIVQLPIFLATLMAGPIGLLLWLIIREPRARATA